jgi:hypothetical protein
MIVLGALGYLSSMMIRFAGRHLTMCRAAACHGILR